MPESCVYHFDYEDNQDVGVEAIDKVDPDCLADRSSFLQADGSGCCGLIGMNDL